MPTPSIKYCLHGSAVSKKGRVTLYLGKPGSGKTRAALEAIRGGAELVADDYVCFEKTSRGVKVFPPSGGSGLFAPRGDEVARLPFVRGHFLASIVLLDGSSAGILPDWLQDCAIHHSYPTITP